MEAARLPIQTQTTTVHQPIRSLSSSAAEFTSQSAARLGQPWKGAANRRPLSGFRGVAVWPMNGRVWLQRGAEGLPRPNQRVSVACRCRGLVVRIRCSASGGPDREPGDGTHSGERETQVSPRICERPGSWPGVFCGLRVAGGRLMSSCVWVFFLFLPCRWICWSDNRALLFIDAGWHVGDQHRRLEPLIHL